MEQQTQEELFVQLKNICVEAKIANATTYGEIKTSLNNFRSNMHSIFDQQEQIENIIDNWYNKSNLSEEVAVNMIIDTLEKDMANQMDWFDDLYDIMIMNCNMKIPEYQIYKETKTGLMPLLRKSCFAAVRRLLEEFQVHDFNQMFKWML